MTVISQATSWQCHNLTFLISVVNDQILDCYQNLIDYTTEIVEHFILGCLFYFVICLILYVGVVNMKKVSFTKAVKNPQRVLFVTAHPDDECMFFGPTILNVLKSENTKVYLMCLSNGSNYGMGTIRKNELYKSCKVLGIPEDNILVKSHTDMPDKMSARWPAEVVAAMILKQVETYDIDTLITFDKHGVSSHMNHCSIYYAIVHLSLQKMLPKDCRVYVIESVNIMRKYWLFLDIPISFLLSRVRYIVHSGEKKIISLAMTQHVSQLVWFRKVYLMFSRYTLLNTLQEMSISDIELDLVDD